MFLKYKFYILMGMQVKLPRLFYDAQGALQVPLSQGGPDAASSGRLHLSIPESGAACTQPGEGCQDVLCFHSFDALKCKFFNR